MPNEITTSCSILASKAGASANSVGASGAANKTFDMDGDDIASLTQLIGFAADEALSIPGDLTPIGMLWIANLDDTNYVELSNDTGGSFAGAVFAKIRPGQRMLFQPTAATIYAQADTAAVRLSIVAVEE